MPFLRYPSCIDDNPCDLSDRFQTGTRTTKGKGKSQRYFKLHSFYVLLLDQKRSFYRVENQSQILPTFIEIAQRSQYFSTHI